MNIYDIISAYCKDNKISVSTLEKESGLGTGTIYKWKDGGATIDNIIKVAQAMGLKASELLARVENG